MNKAEMYLNRAESTIASGKSSVAHVPVVYALMSIAESLIEIEKQLRKENHERHQQKTRKDCQPGS